MDGSDEKSMKGGVLNGSRLHYYTSGVNSHLYGFRKTSLAWLVKQLASEDHRGAQELIDEYAVARFLETHLPSFVGGPFGLMRGVASEQLSLIQHRIHGITLRNLRGYTHLQMCRLFLQCNEFILRVGGSLLMQDVHTDNIMVDLRAQHVKYIDFGAWVLGADPSESHRIMLCNFVSEDEGSLRHLLRLMMGPDNPVFETVYSDTMRPEQCVDTASFERAIYDLPSRIRTHLLDQIPGSESILESEEFQTVQKLCSIRFAQFQLGISADVIDERVQLELCHR
jgi:hypothetical protein